MKFAPPVVNSACFRVENERAGLLLFPRLHFVVLTKSFKFVSLRQEFLNFSSPWPSCALLDRVRFA